MLISVASSNDVQTGVTRLVFYPNQDVLTIRVKIIDDYLVEGTEAFGAQLIVPDHHVGNGLILGKPSLATVFIKDGMLSVHSFIVLLINHVLCTSTDDKNRPTTPTPTPTPPPKITVFFKADSFSAVESDDNITFTVQSSQAFDQPFSVEFCTQNSKPVSAEGKTTI